MNVPLWKVAREINRVMLPVIDILDFPRRKFRQFRYDLNFPRDLKIHEGNVPLKEKVALLIIYQPSGLAKSVLATCRYLVSIGYTPIVVSNCQMAQQDIETLLPDVAILVERPNFGYDFGGYRDGLRLLNLRKTYPEKLIMMNDSIWFPVYAEGAMVDELEANLSGFSGPVYEWHAKRSKKNAHYQSYFYMIKTSVLEHPAFKAYWRRYPLSNTRRHVLISGEKGLTRKMEAAGLVPETNPSRNLMLDRLSRKDGDYLKRVLDYAAYETEELRDQAMDLISSFDRTDLWRISALSHMKRALYTTQPMGTFPYAGLTLMGWNFMKKGSNLRIYDGMRRQYVRAVENGDLPPPAPEIMAEILASKMDASLTTDPAKPS